MAFIRRVRTASGATAVQIAEYVRGGGQRVVRHVGSAHTEAELGVLMAQARELLGDARQGVLDLGVEEREPAQVALLGPAGDSALFAAWPVAPPRPGRGRVTGTASRLLFDALAQVYADLGFGEVEDEVFRDLVVARIVEPASLLDCGRVLADLGREPASYPTMRRRLERCKDENYRDQIASLCFAHAQRSGDISLVLYDVTVRREAFVVRLGVKDLCRGSCRSKGFGAGGSLTGETTGRVGAVSTKPWHVSTVGWRGRGEQAGKAYARNRCHHLS